MRGCHHGQGSLLESRSSTEAVPVISLSHTSILDFLILTRNDNILWISEGSLTESPSAEHSVIGLRLRCGEMTRMKNFILPYIVINVSAIYHCYKHRG